MIRICFCPKYQCCKLCCVGNTGHPVKIAYVHGLRTAAGVTINEEAGKQTIELRRAAVSLQCFLYWLLSMLIPCSPPLHLSLSDEVETLGKVAPAGHSNSLVGETRSRCRRRSAAATTDAAAAYCCYRFCC